MAIQLSDKNPLFHSYLKGWEHAVKMYEEEYLKPAREKKAGRKK